MDSASFGILFVLYTLYLFVYLLPVYRTEANKIKHNVNWLYSQSHTLYFT